MKSISAGLDHFAAISPDGSLYCWGHGESSKLGHGTYSVELEPRLVDDLSFHVVTQVACGNTHTLCLTREGNVYAFGTGEGGRLGNGNSGRQREPARVLDGIEDEKIVHIAAKDISAAVTDDVRTFFLFDLTTNPLRSSSY